MTMNRHTSNGTQKNAQAHAQTNHAGDLQEAEAFEDNLQAPNQLPSDEPLNAPVPPSTDLPEPTISYDYQIPLDLNGSKDDEKPNSLKRIAHGILNFFNSWLAKKLFPTTHAWKEHQNTQREEKISDNWVNVDSNVTRRNDDGSNTHTPSPVIITPSDNSGDLRANPTQNSPPTSSIWTNSRTSDV